MKILITAIIILFTSLLNSQVMVTNATEPNFNDGIISVDISGTNIKKWAIYKVVNGWRQDPEISTNLLSTNWLSPGTYWVLGKTKTDALNRFTLDTLINVSISVVKNCDSLKVTFLNVMQMPDPQNPQNQPTTCISFGIDKASYPMIDKVYIKESNGIQPFYGPNQGGCFQYMPPNSNLYLVFKDANGCSVVGTNTIEYKPTNAPIINVPGTEPDPIKNYVTIGVADCSGYYIHYNNVQYKICNSGAARNIVHLDSIVVSGKFIPDCNYIDTVAFCQMYHPYVGYFWLDSVRAIESKPTGNNCWDNFQLDSAYYWVNLGSQPAHPADTIYAYQFDSINCIWKNEGLKDASLSINELEFNVSFYPNPFKDKIEINLTPDSYGTLTSIEGKIIQIFDGGKTTFDAQKINPGIYFINVTKNQKTISRKVIKD